MVRSVFAKSTAWMGGAGNARSSARAVEQRVPRDILWSSRFRPRLFGQRSDWRLVAILGNCHGLVPGFELLDICGEHAASRGILRRLHRPRLCRTEAR